MCCNKLIPTGRMPAFFIVFWVLSIVILVLIFCGIEIFIFQEGRVHYLLKLSRMVQTFFGGFCHFPLACRMIKYGWGILYASVRKRSAGVCGIELLPVNVQQLPKADDIRIKGDLYRLPVAGLSCGHLLISGFRCFST